MVCFHLELSHIVLKANTAWKMTALYTIIFRDAFLDKYELVTFNVIIISQWSSKHAPWHVCLQAQLYISCFFSIWKVELSTGKIIETDRIHEAIISRAKQRWSYDISYKSIMQILMLKSGPIFFPLILNSRIQTILILLSVEPETKVSLRCLSWKQSEHLVL